MSHLELTSLILTILVCEDAQTAQELCATSGCTRAELALVLGALIEGGAVVTSGLGRGTRYCVAGDPSEVQDHAWHLESAARGRAALHPAVAETEQAPPAPTALELLDAARAARTDYERAANGVGFQWGPIADAMERSADGIEAIIAGRVATALPAGYIMTPGMVQSHRDRAADARHRATAQALDAARASGWTVIDASPAQPDAVLIQGHSSHADSMTAWQTPAGQLPLDVAARNVAAQHSTGDLMRDLEQTAERLAGGATLSQLSARGVA